VAGMRTQVRDEYELYREGTEVEAGLPNAAGYMSHCWEVRSDGSWHTAFSSPLLHPNDSDELMHYRHVRFWDTTTCPTGCNGEHTVYGADYTGNPMQITFTNATETWTNGPEPLSGNVKNLYIDNVECNNGTIDYFKYDPDDEGDLADPTITFTIEDGELRTGCHYKWIIYIWDTGHDTGDPLATASGTAETPGTVEAHLTDEALLSFLPYGLEWGTYTYDIYVLEVDSETGDVVDRYGLKTPYCMEIADHMMDIVEDEIRVKYLIGHSSGMDAESIRIEVLDWHLQEKGFADGPTESGGWQVGPDGKGLLIYTIDESDESLAWRAIWTGSDPDGVSDPNRRTHDAQRMVAVNDKEDDLWARYILKYDSAPVGHISCAVTDVPRLWFPLGGGQGCQEVVYRHEYGYYVGAWVFGWRPRRQSLTGGIGWVDGLLMQFYLPGRDNTLLTNPKDPLITGELVVDTSGTNPVLPSESDYREITGDLGFAFEFASDEDQCDDVLARVYQRLSDSAQGRQAFEYLLEHPGQKLWHGAALDHSQTEDCMFDLLQNNCGDVALLLTARDDLDGWSPAEVEENIREDCRDESLMGVWADDEEGGTAYRYILVIPGCSQAAALADDARKARLVRPDGFEWWRPFH